MGIMNQHRINGEKELTDQTIVEKFLRSFPKKFEMSKKFLEVCLINLKW
jgi:hypothetical protein